MILHDVSIYGTEGRKHIHIENGIIRTIADNREMLADIPGRGIELDGARALPGLINAHDHLDFNLFPALGNRVYNNYTEWGKDIHHVNKTIIDGVLKIPLPLRVRWGLYKNLLNGFTTVMNHGEKLEAGNDLIDIFQECYSLHSASFENNWIWKLNRPFTMNIPFVMHIGEGTDADADAEIDKVIRFNFLKRKIIAVHGVAMRRKQASNFAGLVWCPASNFFLLNKTAPIGKLKGVTEIVFGTDSTLTASWNAWEHFRQAIHTGMVSENELIQMLTVEPARLLKLDDRGMIKEGKKADIIIVKKSAELFSLNPENIAMVVQAGQVKLLDASLEKQCHLPADVLFGKIKMNDSEKFVAGDINGLVKGIRQYHDGIEFPFTGC